jgi:selenocysteine lyase/cysteine desulfurase
VDSDGWRPPRSSWSLDAAAGGVEVAVPRARGAMYLRLSAHLYNERREYVRLAESLRSLIAAPTSATSH